MSLSRSTTEIILERKVVVLEKQVKFLMERIKELEVRINVMVDSQALTPAGSKENDFIWK